VSRSIIRQQQGLQAWLDYIALHVQWWLKEWEQHPKTAPTLVPKAQMRLEKEPRDLKDFIDESC